METAYVLGVYRKRANVTCVFAGDVWRSQFEVDLLPVPTGIPPGRSKQFTHSGADSVRRHAVLVVGTANNAGGGEWGGRIY